MTNNTVDLSPEILQQLAYWRVDKKLELEAQASRKAREDWIMGQIGPLPLAGLTRTLHTAAKVDITLKQERKVDQTATIGLVARRPYLVGSLVKFEYTFDSRQLTAVLSTGQDEALKSEVMSTFTLKPCRPSFKKL